MNSQTQVLEQNVAPMHQNVTNQEESNEGLALKIKDRILKRLGKPRYFYKFDAHHLWANKWRVNVWIKTHGKGEGVVPYYSISDSFFVTVGKNDRISTNPKITKKY